MRINHNPQSLFTLNALKNINYKHTKSLEKLASGQRINRAGDDASGLAISEKMRGQIRGLQMASRNIMDGISLIQTAEGALAQDHEILQRMRELTVQAANDTNTLIDRQAVGREVARLIDETDKILTQTEFNGKKLFLGLDSEPITIQIGANESQTMDILIKKSVLPSFGYLAWEAPGLLIGGPGDDQIIDLSTQSNASTFLTVLDKAINDVSGVRSNLGAMQNRLEHTLTNVAVYQENLTAAESRIRDVDMANEMLKFTSSQIKQQAATAMLAQANQSPRGILQLIG